MTRLARTLLHSGYSPENISEFPHIHPFYSSEGGKDMQGTGVHTAHIPLSAFKTAATAYINYLADQYWVRIVTADGWYVEPPPTNSQMEAIHQVKVWAGQSYDVDVVLDINNHSFQKIGHHERERQLHGKH